MKYLGIDSGITGAIALYSPEYGLLDLWDFPSEQVIVGKKKRNKIIPSLLNRILVDIKDQSGDRVTVFIEANNARPAGARLMGATSIWSMAQAEAYAEMASICAGFATIMIKPKDWKKEIKCPTDKEAARQMALRLFPEKVDMLARKKDHNRAEAALIAYAGVQSLRLAGFNG